MEGVPFKTTNLLNYVYLKNVIMERISSEIVSYSR